MKKTWRVLTVLGTIGGLVFGLGSLVGLFSPPVGSNELIIPNTFTVGQVADPATVNENFSTIADIVNGQLDNDNWDPSGPDLDYGNIDLNASVSSADITDGVVSSADIEDATVALVDMNDDVFPIYTVKTTGPTTDSTPTMSEAVIHEMTAYTPNSINSTLIISASSGYYCFCTSSSTDEIEVSLWVGTTMLGKHGKFCQASASGTEVINFTEIITPTPSPPFDIEIRHERIDTGQNCGQMIYHGTLNPAKIHLVELPR